MANICAQGMTGIKMKIYEICYITGISLAIVSIAIFALSSTMVTTPEPDSVSNLMGKEAVLDTNFTVDENRIALENKEHQSNRLFLWIGIPAGISFFLAGLIIKRKKEGPDLFLDDELEDDE